MCVCVCVCVCTCVCVCIRVRDREREREAGFESLHLVHNYEGLKTGSCKLNVN